MVEAGEVLRLERVCDPVVGRWLHLRVRLAHRGRGPHQEGLTRTHAVGDDYVHAARRGLCLDVLTWSSAGRASDLDHLLVGERRRGSEELRQPCRVLRLLHDALVRLLGRRALVRHAVGAGGPPASKTIRKLKLRARARRHNLQRGVLNSGGGIQIPSANGWLAI